MAMQLQHIPINDAMENAGECPFCYIERKSEEHVMDFVLGHGASYMEPDIRNMTDLTGFCRPHFKKMFDYGNALGNAWILKTHYMRVIDEMNKEMRNFKPSKGKSLFKKKDNSVNNISNWLDKKEHSCFICDSVSNNFNAYMHTFFDMYKNDSKFRDSIKETKGFCMSHFGTLIKYADNNLSESLLKEFYDVVLPLQKDNMERLLEDVSWFVDKYDYNNKDADWKNSKDAIERGMQKLKGGYPSLPPYVLKR